MSTRDVRERIFDRMVNGGITASDYDGCLSPIFPVPAQAYRSPLVLPAFQALGAVPENVVLTVSGRPRKTSGREPGIEDFFRTNKVHNVDTATGLIVPGVEEPFGQFDTEGLGYTLPDGRRGLIHVIASHGADLEPGLVETDTDRALAATLFAEMTPEQQKLRERVLNELPAALRAAHPGFPVTYEVDQENPNQIYLEEKPEGVAVHTRTLSMGHPAEAERVRETASRFYTEKAKEWGIPLYATPGSEVLEIQVRPASKGAPIVYLHAKYPGQRITFIGDDLTDAAAMRKLQPGDATIIIGHRLIKVLEDAPLADGVDVLRLASPAEFAGLLHEAAGRTLTATTPRQTRRRATTRSTAQRPDRRPPRR